MDSPFCSDLDDVTMFHFDNKEVVPSFPPARQTLKLHVYKIKRCQ